jgi:hypothetical protein
MQPVLERVVLQRTSHGENLYIFRQSLQDNNSRWRTVDLMCQPTPLGQQQLSAQPWCTATMASTAFKAPEEQAAPATTTTDPEDVLPSVY